MQITDLQLAYQEATRNNGLLELMAKLRQPNEKYKTKKDVIHSIFTNSALWEEQVTKSGHAKFKHKITQIVIGYQKHGKSTTMDPGGVDKLTDLLQNHLNILANEIFGFRVNNWKEEPNWQQAEQNLAAWHIARANQ
jgi:hypothetical protein